MARVVEHRSALPFGPVVEVHVHYVSEAEFPIQATIEMSGSGVQLDPGRFSQPLSAADALVQAVAYAEQAGIGCVWINDPGGHFPPDKRHV